LTRPTRRDKGGDAPGVDSICRDLEEDPEVLAVRYARHRDDGRRRWGVGCSSDGPDDLASELDCASHSEPAPHALPVGERSERGLGYSSNLDGGQCVWGGCSQLTHYVVHRVLHRNFDSRTDRPVGECNDLGRKIETREASRLGEPA
jgi:hypothetical protein